MTLDTGADAALFTDVASELPSRSRDIGQAINGFQEYGVGKTHLRHPQGTDDMSPLAFLCLFKCPARVWA